MVRRMFIRTNHDPKLNRTWVQIVEFVRAGKKVRQKLLHHVGVAHNDGEIEVIKHSVRQLMEQLRADQTPQNELFFPTEYADLQEVVRKAPRPELDFVKNLLTPTSRNSRLWQFRPELPRRVR